MCVYRCFIVSSKKFDKSHQCFGVFWWVFLFIICFGGCFFVNLVNNSEVGSHRRGGHFVYLALNKRPNSCTGGLCGIVTVSNHVPGLSIFKMNIYVPLSSCHGNPQHEPHQ